MPNKLQYILSILKCKFLSQRRKFITAFLLYWQFGCKRPPFFLYQRRIRRNSLLFRYLSRRSLSLRYVTDRSKKNETNQSKKNEPTQSEKNAPSQSKKNETNQSKENEQAFTLTLWPDSLRFKLLWFAFILGIFYLFSGSKYSLIYFILFMLCEVILVPILVFYIFPIKVLGRIWINWPETMDPWLKNVVQFGKDSPHEVQSVKNSTHRKSKTIAAKIKKCYSFFVSQLELIDAVKDNTHGKPKTIATKIKNCYNFFLPQPELICVCKDNTHVKPTTIATIKKCYKHFISQLELIGALELIYAVKDDTHETMKEINILFIPQLEPTDPVYWKPRGSCQETFLKAAIIDALEPDLDMKERTLFRNPFMKWLFIWCFPIWSSLIFIISVNFFVILEANEIRPNANTGITQCQNVNPSGKQKCRQLQAKTLYDKKDNKKFNPIFNFQIVSWVILSHLFVISEIYRIKKWARLERDDLLFLPPPVRAYFVPTSDIIQILESGQTKKILSIMATLIGFIFLLLFKLFKG
jgi:hypothetical protein